MKKSFYILFITVLLPLIAFAQTEDLDRQINAQSKKLKEIRKEIDQLNSKISKSQKDEKTTRMQIEQLDKQITMITVLKRGLQNERRLKEKEIDVLKETIQATDKKIMAMKKRAARRAINAYKLGQNRDIDLLLTSGDINQVLRRTLYLSAINRAERQTLEQLQSLIVSKKTSQNSLARRLGEVKRNIAEEDRAAKDKAAIRRRKASLAKNLTKDRTSLEQEKKTKLAAAKEMQGKINDLEKEVEARKEWARSQGLVGYGEFSKYRGKLNWPVQGTLVSRFGPHKHEKLGTVTNNPGIDIAAPEGRNVKAVMNGIVVAITWIPGYGNTIIVDHGESYYTVYAHVDNIQVNLDKSVLGGDVVAQVSDTGSLDGPRLHFEVWQGKNKVDPLTWLKR